LTFKLVVILSLFSFFPAIVALARIRTMNVSFKWITAYLVFVFLCEVVNLLLILYHGTNAISTNIFLLVSFDLIIRQLESWDKRKVSISLTKARVLSTVLWMAECIAYKGIDQFFSVTVMVQSIIMIGLCSVRLYRKIKKDEIPVYKDAELIFIFNLLVYFSFSLLIELYFQLERLVGHIPDRNIAAIFSVVNLIVNILNLFAVLCISHRPNYLLSRLRHR